MKDTMRVFKRVLPYDYEDLLTQYVNDLNVVVEPVHCEALTEIMKELMTTINSSDDKTLLEEVMVDYREQPMVQAMLFAFTFWSWSDKREPYDAWNEITEYIDWKLFVGGATACYGDFNDHKVELGELAENWREFNDWYINSNPDKGDFVAIFKGSDPKRVRLNPSFSSTQNIKGWGWL